MSAHWSQAKEQGSSIAYWGMRLMLGAYQVGGRWLFSLILYPVMAWFFLASTAARRASRDYLARLSRHYPELKLKPTNYLSWQHFLCFADIIFDKLNAWTGRIPASTVQCIGREAMLAHLAQGRGGILLTAHLGNLEVLQAFSEGSRSLVLNVLVHTRHAAQFNRVLAARQASAKGATIRLIQVDTLDAALAATLSELVAAGEWIAIAGDRVPVVQGASSPQRTVDVDFLGDTAALPLGPHILALLLGCPLVLVVCLKLRKNYSIYFETLAEQVTATRTERPLRLQQSAQHYADRLAHYCQLAPLQWFNFYSFWRDHDSN